MCSDVRPPGRVREVASMRSMRGMRRTVHHGCIDSGFHVAIYQMEEKPVILWSEPWSITQKRADQVIAPPSRSGEGLDSSGWVVFFPVVLQTGSPVRGSYSFESGSFVIILKQYSETCLIAGHILKHVHIQPLNYIKLEMIEFHWRAVFKGVETTGAVLQLGGLSSGFSRVLRERIGMTSRWRPQSQ